MTFPSSFSIYCPSAMLVGTYFDEAYCKRMVLVIIALFISAESMISEKRDASALSLIHI